MNNNHNIKTVHMYEDKKRWSISNGDYEPETNYDKIYDKIANRERAIKKLFPVLFVLFEIGLVLAVSIMVTKF